MATTTVRLPEALKAESEAFAASLGISLNALMAVALRDYLDARQVTQSSALRSPPPPAPKPALKAVPVPPAASAVTQVVAAPASKPGAIASIKPPRSRSDPCPCGSVDTLGRRLKFKHCHGQV